MLPRLISLNLKKIYQLYLLVFVMSFESPILTYLASPLYLARHYPPTGLRVPSLLSPI